MFGCVCMNPTGETQKEKGTEAVWVGEEMEQTIMLLEREVKVCLAVHTNRQKKDDSKNYHIQIYKNGQSKNGQIFFFF